MYIVGEQEIDAIAKVIRQGALFRYGVGAECDEFERRYADYLGVKHACLSSSGSYGLSAALIGLGIGPGDEVLVPAHTYMATATSVLSVGAIPVIVDIDETITIDPAAADAAVGPRTRAIIPVHMWGAACDMDAIMKVAAKHDLFVVEDACQGVGGGYHGRMLGSIGHAGVYSFNYYKNMTAGEGGAVVTNDPRVAERIKCAIDPCHFYWQGRSDDMQPFAGNGARASEIMGAMLNVQLDRLPGIISAMRAEKKQILEGTTRLANLGMRQTPMNSPDHDCATHVMFTMPSAAAAQSFADVFPSVIAGKTGRHSYVEWDQVLKCAGASHPAMNPYEMPQNAECRREYSKDMCAVSLDIMDRTILVPTHPEHTQQQIDETIHNVVAAGRVALDDLARDDVDIRNARPVDARKFDLEDTVS